MAHQIILCNRQQRRTPRRHVSPSGRPTSRASSRNTPRSTSARTHVLNPPTDSADVFTSHVRRRFSHEPEIYRKFMTNLSAMDEPDCDMMKIINQVVMLFENHGDLILGFNQFLPENYRLELQEDAVVVKVFESHDETQSQTGRSTQRSELHDSVQYVRLVKQTYLRQPQVYERFIQILHNYHSQKLSTAAAVQKVVSLFRGYPNLVLGFNEFLPEGYAIKMFDSRAYTIEYPNGSSAKVSTDTA